MLHYRLPSVFAFITHFTFNAVPKHFRRIPKYSDAFRVHSTSLFKVFILHSDLITPPFPVESYLGVPSAFYPFFGRILASPQRSIPRPFVYWSHVVAAASSDHARSSGTCLLPSNGDLPYLGSYPGHSLAMETYSFSFIILRTLTFSFIISRTFTFSFIISRTLIFTDLFHIPSAFFYS